MGNVAQIYIPVIYFGKFMIQKRDDPIKKVLDKYVDAISGQKLQNQQKWLEE